MTRLHQSTLWQLMPLGLILLYGGLGIRGWLPMDPSDVLLYHRYADLVGHGAIPYRDFRPEYPPLALLYFLLPYWMGSTGGSVGRSPLAYLLLFTLLSGLLASLAGGVLRQLPNQEGDSGTELRVQGQFWLLLVPLLPILAWRFDLLPMLMTLLAFRDLRRDRNLQAGLWLSLGIGVKLYPLFLVGVGTLYLKARERSLRPFGLGLGIGLLAGFLPALIAVGSGLMGVLTYHQERDLHLETLAAGVLLLLKWVGLDRPIATYSHASWGLVGSIWLPLLQRLLPLLLVIGLVLLHGWVWRCFRREWRQDGQIHLASLNAAWLGVLLLLLLTGKVFSTQFMIWLLPYFALLNREPWWMSVWAVCCSGLLYPFLYGDLITGLSPGVLILNLRNLLLFLVLVAQVRKLLGPNPAAVKPQRRAPP